MRPSVPGDETISPATASEAWPPRRQAGGLAAEKLVWTASIPQSKTVRSPGIAQGVGFALRAVREPGQRGSHGAPQEDSVRKDSLWEVGMGWALQGGGAKGGKPLRCMGGSPETILG